MQNLILGISSEYFAEVDEYAIIHPRQNGIKENREIIKTLTGTTWLKFNDRKNSVINSAIGVEYKYDENITGYLGFRTNFRNNKLKPVYGREPGISNWDIYHTSVGAIYKLHNQEISLAFRGSFGSNSNFTQLTNFNGSPKVNNEYSILGAKGTTEANYWLLGVSMGFTYFLN